MNRVGTLRVALEMGLSGHIVRYVRSMAAVRVLADSDDEAPSTGFIIRIQNAYGGRARLYAASAK
jgi:hypothetical protein